jgi:diguanylate cyclase (GGDEF)-like protein
MDSPPVLLVSDHRGHGWSASLAALAERGFRLEESASLLQSLRALATRRPALLLFDPLNPGGRIEYEALDEARRGEPALPVLVVADADDPVALRRADECLQGGAWDWIWRDAGTEELRLRLGRLLQVRRSHEELADLRHRAAHDDRTDLLRPQAFQARMAEHFSAAQRHGLELAFVLLDLDRFGQINKRHDHTVGDALIARVGEAIKKTIRTEDVAGRLGGDEFAVLLPYTGKLDAAQVVKRLRDAIHRLSGTLTAGASAQAVQIEVSASIGFETFDGRDLKSMDELRAHAESALRSAKQRGGDQAVYFRAPEEGGADAAPAEAP